MEKWVNDQRQPILGNGPQAQRHRCRAVVGVKMSHPAGVLFAELASPYRVAWSERGRHSSRRYVDTYEARHPINHQGHVR